MSRHAARSRRDLPTLVVLAKAPVPGLVKTRLCPPCTPAQAAALAAAALADTLEAAARSRAGRIVLALDGDPRLVPGADAVDAVVAQSAGGLDARLAGAFADAGGPALLVGMDTPQVAAVQLDAGLTALAGGARAVLGLAPDGGYWAIGLRTPDPRLFHGVPMSSPRTAAEQLRRLREHAREPVLLGALRDVDTIADARAVAAAAPGSRFAAVLAEQQLEALAA